jgi:hypothetical protein
MVSAAEHEQQGKDDKVQLSFPDFGRPEWLGAIGVGGEGGCRIDDTKGAASWGTEGITVEKVGTAAQGLSQDDGRGKDVHEVDGVEMMMAAVEDARDDAKEDAALDGHATLPDIQ